MNLRHTGVGIGGDAAAGGGAVQGQRVAVQRGQGQRRPQLLGGEGGTKGGACERADDGVGGVFRLKRGIGREREEKRGEDKTEIGESVGYFYRLTRPLPPCLCSICTFS